ncbi:N-acetylhexosamine 1-kinase [Acaryochloris thomasi RCC1774]|uniref:N-acetylhexosamine 1-kinase n=1 Tax=Acaryochloris thomasi RCC1774 TaxID=1764569 RepID=A0A2W1JSQ2_9CYAN|nr:N-acetylhexosamine 1-kinase [Acaryochloris thomasi RCC1774]
MDRILTIAAQFAQKGRVATAQEFGQGNVNDTYLVTLDSGEAPFVLQRINTHVFRQPELVMRNMRTFTEHVRQRQRTDVLCAERRWDVPQVLLTQSQQDHWLESDGTVWRAISFIDAAQSFDTIQSLDHAREVGYGLGMFHHLISDLPSEQLADTLEGFHITPRYLQQYESVLEQNSMGSSPEVNYCRAFICDRTSLAHTLETAKAKGLLPLRLMHGDPKINNIMIDAVTGQAVSLIDLDTVKPGLVHYDIGDCLRSSCNPLGEETDQWESVCFDLDLSQAVLQGYLSVARSFLTPTDYDYLFDAIRLIAFELGLRFFTDYLMGDRYFKTQYPDHNLARALVQFKLTESIEAQERSLKAIIQDLRR